MITPIRTESRDQVITRLAEKARREGIKLYRDGKDGRYYASSVSRPSTKHYVTAISCDCAGFANYARCKHHAALLVALGWAGPDDLNPEPSIAALPVPIFTCDECRGTGSVHGTVPTGPTTWAYSDIVCPTCHGRGEFSCSACIDRGIIEVENGFCGQTRTVCTCEAGQALTVRDLAIVERETGDPVYLDEAA